MEGLQHYIQAVLGLEIQFREATQKDLDGLPFFIKKGYKFKYAAFLKRSLLLLEPTEDQELPVRQIEKQFLTIGQTLNKILVLVARDLTAITRKRLIEKGMNFIVPGKQLYLPALLLDFNETFRKAKPQKKNLLPSAQVILIYRILKRDERLEELPLKILAKKLNYTAMAITKAVENLKYHNLCEVKGTKEKYVHFLPVPALWDKAMPLLTNPVLKQVYVDEFPKGISLMRSNTSALPEYTDMSESHQQYRALEKGLFYNLQKRGALINANAFEGHYCLEVWKYDPVMLTEGVTESTNVDPISLYLTLQDNNDERIQRALGKIKEKFIW